MDKLSFMDKIETVVFDLGKVLIGWDPRNLYQKIFKNTSEMEWFLTNVCNGSWNVEQDRGRSFKVAVARKQSDFPKYHKEIALYFSRWSEMISGPIHGTVDLLEKLYKCRKCRLYALTNWSAETFPYALQEFEFLKYFEGILVSGKEKLIKPDSNIYHLLFERFDIDPERSLFIDDSIHNVNAAIDVGMNGIHFRNAQQLEQELQNYDIS